MKSTRKSKNCPPSQLSAGAIERASNSCPPHMSESVKKALEKEIDEFNKAEAKQSANVSAAGGPTLDAYQEWLEQHGGNEVPEANPDVVSDEDGIKYLPSNKDGKTTSLLKEFRQSLSENELRVWTLMMKHSLSRRKTADLLSLDERDVGKYLRRAKQKMQQFSEGFRHA